MPVLFVLFFPEGDERLIAFFFAVLVAMSKCIHDASHIIRRKSNRRSVSQLIIADGHVTVKK